MVVLDMVHLKYLTLIDNELTYTVVYGELLPVVANGQIIDVAIQIEVNLIIHHLVFQLQVLERVLS